MTDMHLAWVRLSAAEDGTPEKTLSELLRRRGASTICRGLDIDRTMLGRWIAVRSVPDGYHERIAELYRTQVATDQRAGLGKISVAKAVEMAEAGEKQEVIAATFEVTQQAVSKTLKKHRARRSEDNDAA